MTPADITLVKDSFRKIVPIADQAAALFYARLFELDPALPAVLKYWVEFVHEGGIAEIRIGAGEDGRFTYSVG